MPGHGLGVDLDNLPAGVTLMATGFSNTVSALGSLPLGRADTTTEWNIDNSLIGP